MQIGTALDVTGQAAGKWRNRFAGHRLDGLDDAVAVHKTLEEKPQSRSAGTRLPVTSERQYSAAAAPPAKPLTQTPHDTTNFGTRTLVPVDGFDQDEGVGERDEGFEVGFGFLAAQCDGFEAPELSDGLFDAGAAPIERPCEPLRSVFDVLPAGDDGQGAFFPGALAGSSAVTGLVRNDDAGPRSLKVSNCGLSAAWPPVRSKAIGKPSKSVFRWIFVPKPPRERPSFGTPRLPSGLTTVARRARPSPATSK